MVNQVRNRLPDPIPSLEGFEGIINTRRSKDVGYGGLTIGRNVEVTNEKKLVRRNGYIKLLTAAYSALYGSQTQKQLLAVRGGDLVLVGADQSESALAAALDGDYSWDEDPANNVYYTSTNGSNGIVLADNTWLPLALAVPTITDLAVVTTAPWAVVPFNLGKTYTTNVMQLFATYVYPDGRESAPSEVVSVSVAPEVSLLRATVPVHSGCTTLVYATVPGGSRYFLVASSEVGAFTFSVKYLHQQYTGPDYPFTTALTSFPAEAYLLSHYGGRLYAGCYDPTTQNGVVYMSMPLMYHLFDQSKDFISTSGAPLLLLECKAGLVIGTDSNLYLWNGETLRALANYGVVAGVCGDTTMEGTAYFWTLRGIGRVDEEGRYVLVTETKFSGDPGTFNHARIFYDRGYAKLVASTIAGNPIFNEWSGK